MKYAVESQIKLHGYDPKSSLITIAPREGQDTLHTEDILAAIEKHGSSTAVIMLSGVQYYTGQWFEMEKITAFGHEQVCISQAIILTDVDQDSNSNHLGLYRWLGSCPCCW